MALNLLLNAPHGPLLSHGDSASRISLIHADGVDEVLQSKIAREIPNAGQKSDGQQTFLVKKPEARFALEGKTVPEFSAVEVSIAVTRSEASRG
jgi:hypothetical protein